MVKVKYCTIMFSFNVEFKERLCKIKSKKEPNQEDAKGAEVALSFNSSHSLGACESWTMAKSLHLQQPETGLQDTYLEEEEGEDIGSGKYEQYNDILYIFRAYMKRAPYSKKVTHTKGTEKEKAESIISILWLNQIHVYVSLQII